MMWCIVIVALLMGLAACQTTPTAQEITPEATPPVMATPTQVEAWSHLTAQGVSLSIQIPRGWQSMSNDYGILLAEHAELHNATTRSGILVYIFVPVLTDINPHMNDYDNLAWGLLDSVTHMGNYVGDSTTSETAALQLDGHQAAYYLLSDAKGNRTLVVGVRVPEHEQVVVLNFSSSDADAPRIRQLLPVILSRVTINGTTVDPSALDGLPDPLVFPQHERRATAEATAGA